MITSMYKYIAITNKDLVKGDYIKQLEKVLRTRPFGMLLREKGMEEKEYEQLAGQVLPLAELYGVPCFIHSRIDLAKRLSCPNIHLPMPVLMELVKKHGKSTGEYLHSSFKQVSVACHSKEDVELAVANGATLIILGTIYETECKRGLAGKGIGFVREICSECHLPVFAIGGVSPERMPELLEAGATGGCMMSGFMKLTDEREMK